MPDQIGVTSDDKLRDKTNGERLLLVFGLVIITNGLAVHIGFGDARGDV